MRVLTWIVDRCHGRADAVETPIGYEPKAEDINLEGLDLSRDTLRGLLDVDRELWRREADGIEEFYAKFGSRLPQALRDQLAQLRANLA